MKMKKMYEEFWKDVVGQDEVPGGYDGRKYGSCAFDWLIYEEAGLSPDEVAEMVRAGDTLP